MKTRYEDELHSEFDMDEHLQDYSSIKLILQPLIENAIYHGIRPKGVPGSISVSGRLLDDSIEFTVTDDGVGMDEKSLARLNEVLSNKADPDRIGLQNVQARIKLFYGEGYGISIDSRLGGGTAVAIRIPAQKVSPDSLSARPASK